jgi:hypothetical protein
MKKIIKKITSLLGGLALAVGVSSPVVASQPNLKQENETSLITESSPLYLQHAINIFSQDDESYLGWHYSHSSHSSHSSHVSHRSHYSHYSS